MAKELGRVETFDSPDIINTDTGTTTKLSVPVSMILYFMLFFTTLLVFLVIGLVVFIKTQNLTIALICWIGAFLALPFTIYFYYRLRSFFRVYDQDTVCVERPSIGVN